MKNKKYIKPIPKDILTTPLQLVLKAAIFLWFLLFVTSFVFIFLTTIDYMKAPGQYDAANYESLGAHVFYYRDIEAYRTLAKKNTKVVVATG